LVLGAGGGCHDGHPRVLLSGAAAHRDSFFDCGERNDDTGRPWTLRMGFCTEETVEKV
jgi:hypothetical protein